MGTSSPTSARARSPPARPFSVGKAFAGQSAATVRRKMALQKPQAPPLMVLYHPMYVCLANTIYCPTDPSHWGPSCAWRVGGSAKRRSSSSRAQSGVCIKNKNIITCAPVRVSVWTCGHWCRFALYSVSRPSGDLNAAPDRAIDGPSLDSVDESMLVPS